MSFFNTGSSLELTYRAGDWMALNDRRMALANRVTGNETPREIAAIAQEDKALTLQAERAKIEEEVGWAMRQAEQRRKEQARERRQNALNNGVIFG